VTQELVPLAYHTDIAARLEALEPRGWAVFARAAGQPASGTTHAAGGEEVTLGDDLEAQLLRHAYRMEPEAHPRVHAAARRAGDALGISVPITIYQLEGADGANAALAYRPNEAVIALSGNLLALLGDDELVACFGHELAHHRLWSGDGSRLLIADRFLAALGIDAATPPSYLETGRRFDLATELYADRGSLVACGSLEVAISSLVKVVTGLSDVDPAAYLRQARDAHPERGAAGDTHPETVLRAWALERWASSADGDGAVRVLLSPGLDIERLDLVDRERLETLTRRLVMDVVASDRMRTDALTAHARQFLVELRATPQAVAIDARVPADASPETRRFLAYVLLDLATVDPDLGDESMIECLAVAREAGIDAAFGEVARKELAPNARTWAALERRALDRRQPAIPPMVAAPPPPAEPPSDESPST
jgi:hypothetical protein